MNAAGLILREILQNDVSSSLVGLSVVSDTRNDRLAPTAGPPASALSLEGAGLGGFSRFARARGARDLLPRRAELAARPLELRGGGARGLGGSVQHDRRLRHLRSARRATPTLLALGPQFRRLEDIDDDLTLPLTERYFLGGLGQFQLRGFKARSVGPAARDPAPGRAATCSRRSASNDAAASATTTPTSFSGGNVQRPVQPIDDRDIDDFDDLDETDVIGGNKFSSASFEYRFPISETIGLQGVAFIDMGNAFDERQWNLFDVTEWRYGTGAGVQWFSPFGPLAVVLGFPLDRLSVEKPTVFEFSIGGSAF